MTEKNPYSEKLATTGVARRMLREARACLENGANADEIFSGMMGAMLALMHAQGLSKMEVSNRLQVLFDQARDEAFGEASKG